MIFVDKCEIEYIVQFFLDNRNLSVKKINYLAISCCDIFAYLLSDVKAKFCGLGLDVHGL